jgi:6-phosphogluconolactonase
MNRVHQFSEHNWAVGLATLLGKAISECVETNEHCNVMLTGGRSAEVLYTTWANQPDFQKLANVSFYFGDERCVSPDDPQSNYGLAERTLFAFGTPVGCKVHRMNAESNDLQQAADDYASVLPEFIDILLLSMGEDGHIASLFPNALALNETERSVVPVIGPKMPAERLTITSLVIRSAKRIFILACGNKKVKLFKQLSNTPNDYFSLPARLALHGEWVTHS